jgi:thymidylate synthase
MIFKNATDVFEFYFIEIMATGNEKNGTKYLRNISFTIKEPMDNIITTKWRRFNLKYAEREWQWYLSANRNIDALEPPVPKIWKQISDDNGNTFSNYGWQWHRGNQLNYVINELRKNLNSRRACISIYDGKENHSWVRDVPCTLAICFYIENDKLCMSVYMRSNDLVFGFCNDQYCFSKLQQKIANELNIKVGYYHHSATDFHIYERHYKLTSNG